VGRTRLKYSHSQFRRAEQDPLDRRVQQVLVVLILRLQVRQDQQDQPVHQEVMVVMEAQVQQGLLVLPDQVVPQVVMVTMVELGQRVLLDQQVVRQVSEHRQQALDQ